MVITFPIFSKTCNDVSFLRGKSIQIKKNNNLTLKSIENCIYAIFGPFPVKIDLFRSQGVTSGIWQCQLRLRSEYIFYALTGSADLRNLNVDQTQGKLIKILPKGVLSPFPVIAKPMTGQHVVIKLTPGYTSLLISC